MTGNLAPSDRENTSLVNPKSATLAVPSSAISTFRAARSLYRFEQILSSLVNNRLDDKYRCNYKFL